MINVTKISYSCLQISYFSCYISEDNTVNNRLEISKLYYILIEFINVWTEITKEPIKYTITSIFYF